MRSNIYDNDIVYLSHGEEKYAVYTKTIEMAML